MKSLTTTMEKVPAWNCSVDKRGIRSPTKWIRMRKASRLHKPTFILHKKRKGNS